MIFDSSLLGKKVRVTCIENEPCDIVGEVFGLDTYSQVVAVMLPFEQARKVCSFFDVDYDYREEVFDSIVKRVDVLDETIGELEEKDFPCTVNYRYLDLY